MMGQMIAMFFVLEKGCGERVKGLKSIIESPNASLPVAPLLRDLWSFFF